MYRVVLDGKRFFIEKRCFLFFWSPVKYYAWHSFAPVTKYFDTVEEAEEYYRTEISPKKDRVVKYL